MELVFPFPFLAITRQTDAFLGTLCNACGVKWKHGKILQHVGHVEANEVSLTTDVYTASTVLTGGGGGGGGKRKPTGRTAKVVVKQEDLAQVHFLVQFSLFVDLFSADQRGGSRRRGSGGGRRRGRGKRRKCSKLKKIKRQFFHTFPFPQ